MSKEDLVFDAGVLNVRISYWKVAGAEGFEPTSAGIKIQCLKPLDDAPASYGSSSQRF